MTAAEPPALPAPIPPVPALPAPALPAPISLAPIPPVPALPAPALLVLTDRRQVSAPLLDVIAAAVAGGARHVVLREKDLPLRVRERLARRMRTLLEQVGGRLIVAGTDPLGGDAVHLSSTDPMLVDRPSADGSPVGLSLVGRSCHDGDELGRLSIEDYATLSPIFASESKPGYGPALGVSRLGELCRRTHIKVVALGGLDSPAKAEACLAAGASGVAVMGAVMRASDPATVVRSFLRAMPTMRVPG